MFVARMSEHYPTEEEGRIPVEAFLRAWEVSAALSRGHEEIRFEFERAEMIDRQPRTDGTVFLTGRVTAQVNVSATVIVVTSKYPSPPNDFAVVPLVETLWRRYERYSNGKEPLFAMSYFCLTVLEREAGDRRGAAAKFGVHKSVLNKIGELSSARGDETTARKATNQLQPASGNEVRWLEAAIRALITNVGTAAGGGHPETLCMKNLPVI